MKQFCRIPSMALSLLGSVLSYQAYASDISSEFNLSRKSNSVFANEKSIATLGFNYSVSNSGAAQYALSQDQMTGYVVSQSAAYLNPDGPSQGKVKELQPGLLVANVVGVLSNGLKPFGSIHTNANKPGNETGFSLGLAAHAHDYVGVGVSMHKATASGDDPTRLGATVMLNLQMFELPKSDVTLFYAKDAYFVNAALGLTDELAAYGTYEKEVILETINMSTFLVGIRFKPLTDGLNIFSTRAFLQRSLSAPKGDLLVSGSTQTDALGLAPMFKVAQDKDIEFGGTYGRSFSKDQNVHFVSWTAFAGYVQTF